MQYKIEITDINRNLIVDNTFQGMAPQLVIEEFEEIIPKNKSFDKKEDFLIEIFLLEYCEGNFFKKEKVIKTTIYKRTVDTKSLDTSLEEIHNKYRNPINL
jgi:hypothetical protein